MTQFSIVARLPVTKTAASSSDNCNPEPVMRNPRQRDIISCDRDDFAGAVAANLRAGFADERERFVDHDRAGVNTGFDTNRLVRRSRIDAFLKRRSSGVRKQSMIA